MRMSSIFVIWAFCEAILKEHVCCGEMASRRIPGFHTPKKDGPHLVRKLDISSYEIPQMSTQNNVDNGFWSQMGAIFFGGLANSTNTVHVFLIPVILSDSFEMIEVVLRRATFH